jgi:hypothetical protein
MGRMMDEGGPLMRPVKLKEWGMKMIILISVLVLSSER